MHVKKKSVPGICYGGFFPELYLGCLPTTTKYVPYEVDGQTCLIIMQKRYCKVFWKNSKGIVEQAYLDIQ